MGVAEDTITDGVSGGGITKVVVPLRSRQLRGDHGGAEPVLVVHDLVEVAAFGGTDLGEAPVVEDEHVGLREASEQMGVAAIGVGDREPPNSGLQSRPRSSSTRPREDHFLSQSQRTCFRPRPPTPAAA